MKIVIIGVGGMGAVSLSHMIAAMAMNRSMEVISTEIHGMAKKGGMVEIYMKIGASMSPFILPGEAHHVLLFSDEYLEYARGFLLPDGKLLRLSDEEKLKIVNSCGDIRFSSSYLLGRFVVENSLFGKDDAIAVLDGFKNAIENKKCFERGLKNDF